MSHGPGIEKRANDGKNKANEGPIGCALFCFFFFFFREIENAR